MVGRGGGPMGEVALYFTLLARGSHTALPPLSWVETVPSLVNHRNYHQANMHMKYNGFASVKTPKLQGTGPKGDLKLARNGAPSKCAPSPPWLNGQVAFSTAAIERNTIQSREESPFR